MKWVYSANCRSCEAGGAQMPRFSRPRGRFKESDATWSKHVGHESEIIHRRLQMKTDWVRIPRLVVIGWWASLRSSIWSWRHLDLWTEQEVAAFTLLMVGPWKGSRGKRCGLWLGSGAVCAWQGKSGAFCSLWYSVGWIESVQNRSTQQNCWPTRRRSQN